MKQSSRSVVWQKSMAFVCKVYNVTRGFPKERYGLTSQT